ncbi:GNAT family N-acetyltransferase [Filobacillus milosensis]|uniref:GNAT family N-acetyltransferase n=1 Tax=Filobacillus milosensis TaxID=94137 RepID=A0A4Y8IKS3_9BACI|nr:GNAT family N-acetyltransferase [Filobacillus milosensis]TFB21744.1 GNAT family N-acetyltransferase [Filobacillus milosensis]
MKVRLTKPRLELEQQFYEYMEEWAHYKEKVVPTILRNAGNSYPDFVQNVQKASEGQVLEGWVANSTYFLIDENNNILGSCNLRHDLNQKLLEIGGHCGYGVRPTERGKGYATEILKQSLDILRGIGIKRALITCNDDNIASRKVILNNDGVQDESFTEEDDTIVNRFWINLGV